MLLTNARACAMDAASLLHKFFVFDPSLRQPPLIQYPALPRRPPLVSQTPPVAVERSARPKNSCSTTRRPSTLISNAGTTARRSHQTRVYVIMHCLLLLLPLLSSDVGLCEALVNFSQTFSPLRPAELVRTERFKYV